jgi:hypothetical protein
MNTNVDKIDGLKKVRLTSASLYYLNYEFNYLIFTIFEMLHSSPDIILSR